MSFGRRSGKASKPGSCVPGIAQLAPNLHKEAKMNQEKKKPCCDEDGFIEPEYSVMHRGYFDVQVTRVWLEGLVCACVSIEPVQSSVVYLIDDNS